MVLRAVAACGVRVGAEWLALSISGAWSGGGEGTLGEGVGVVCCAGLSESGHSSSPLL